MLAALATHKAMNWLETVNTCTHRIHSAYANPHQGTTCS